MSGTKLDFVKNHKLLYGMVHGCMKFRKPVKDHKTTTEARALFVSKTERKP